MNQKGFAPLIVLSIVILIVVLTGGIYYLKSSTAPHLKTTSTKASPSTNPSASSPLSSNYPPQDTSTTTIFDVKVTSSGSPKNVTLDTQNNLEKITISVGSSIYLHSQSNASYTYLLNPASGVIEPVQGTINLPMNDFALLKAVGPGNSTITVSKQSQAIKNSNSIDYSSWKTYSNSQYGFTIKYPSFMKQEDLSNLSGYAGAVGFIPLCVDGDILCLSYPPEHSPELINFEGAAVAISINKDNVTKDSCQNSQDQSGRPTTVYPINGVNFYEQNFEQGATGHTQEGDQYRTFHNSGCYDISIGTDSYRCDGQEIDDPKTGKSTCDGKPMVNDGQILEELTQVIDTFKFTN